MIFSSVLFIMFFLPFVIVGNYLLKKKFRNYFLLVMSLLFYIWGEPKFIWIFLISMLGNYVFGLAIDVNKNQKKQLLALGIMFNLGILVYYKYIGFILGNVITIFKIDGMQDSKLMSIALPIGISFYTFQAMSYLIDLYRGQVKVQKNPFKIMLYISLFPQLIAGPIVRYIDVEREIESRDISIDDLYYGCSRFIIGLAKKVLISNSVAEYADLAFSNSSIQLTTGAAWVGIICYTLQIYFDFSGYSDMAIGIGQMLGFKFLENFNYPYIAKSVREFWARWHISLSSWLKDYLYIPLGGNRKGYIRTYINLFVVFSICGIWHGADWTFLIWGIYYGILSCIERIPIVNGFLQRIPKILRHIYTLFVVMIGWVFFRADSILQAFEYIKTMFGIKHGDIILIDQVSIKLTVVACCMGILFSTPIIPKLYDRILEKLYKYRWIIKVTRDALLVLIFIISIIRVVPDNYNPFIYFRF